MKRVKNLFPQMISDENIRLAIQTVNKTHKTHRGRINKTVLWIERTMAARIEELRQIVLNGFKPSPMKEKRRYDHSAKKWRNICQPKLWPDQYIHHMLIQVLQPVIMRPMDFWSCGSIKGRGTRRGMVGLKRWVKLGPHAAKYAAELDIYHFYDSLKPKVVLNRLKQLVKDTKILDIVSTLIQDKIPIGAYYSQWFANMVLTPLDHYIREQLGIRYYIRYMDNLTLLGPNKKKLHKVVRDIQKYMGQIGLELKSNWQVYRIAARPICDLGYRYGKDFTLLRKETLLRLKRKLHKFYKDFQKEKITKKVRRGCSRALVC